jgi:DNA-binding transcriptional LysR family regulator
MFLEVAEADAGEAGQIRFAASHSLCNTVLPGFLQSYLARCPKVELSLLTGDAIKVRELILARKIDVGLAVETRTGGPRNRSALASGAFVFACHRDHIDKSREVLVLGDKGEEVLALREALRGRKALSKIRLMHTQSWEVITSLAAAGVGVGYVPDFLVDEKKGLHAIDLGVPRSLYDIVPHGADTLAHSRTIRRFMDEMIAYFKKGI